MPRLLLALALLLLAPSAQADDFAHTTWANLRGSFMHIVHYNPAYKAWYGYYLSNEKTIPPHCRSYGQPLATYVDGQNIEIHTNGSTQPEADCKAINTVWKGRVYKKPRRICAGWVTTMPSGQVIKGGDAFWLVAQGSPTPDGPWVWRSRPRSGACRGYVSHGPQRLPDPLIPRPPIQPPPPPSPSPYVK